MIYKITIFPLFISVFLRSLAAVVFINEAVELPPLASVEKKNERKNKNKSDLNVSSYSSFFNVIELNETK